MFIQTKHRLRRHIRSLRFAVVRKKSLEALKNSYHDDAQRSMDLRLENAVMNSDHFFDRACGEAMLSYALSHRLAAYQGEVFVKVSRNRFESFNGLSAYQNLVIEAHCLARFNVAFSKAEFLPFPRLIDVDLESRALVMTHTGGPCLRALKERVRVPHYIEQVDNIVSKLTSSGVVQLDLSSRNLTIDRQGRISLIDFDICAVDGIAYGVHQENALREFYQAGGMERFRQRLIEELRSCELLALK